MCCVYLQGIRNVSRAVIVIVCLIPTFCSARNEVLFDQSDDIEDKKSVCIDKLSFESHLCFI